MFWIIGGGLWLASGCLFVSRICRFDAPEEDPSSSARSDYPFTPASAGDQSLSRRDAVPAVVEPAPAAGTLVFVKNGLNEPPRASSFRLGRMSGGD